MLHRQPNLLKFGGTDVRAISVAKIDDQQLAAKFSVIASAAGLVSEREGATNGAPTIHQIVHQLSGGALLCALGRMAVVNPAAETDHYEQRNEERQFSVRDCPPHAPNVSFAPADASKSFLGATCSTASTKF